MKKRRYSKETKQNVTHEICEMGESTGVTAARYDIPRKTVEKWVTAYNKNNKVYEPEPDIVNEDAEQTIKRLQKENARLRRDNEILKKTLSLLAKSG